MSILPVTVTPSLLVRSGISLPMIREDPISLPISDLKNSSMRGRASATTAAVISGESPIPAAVRSISRSRRSPPGRSTTDSTSWTSVPTSLPIPSGSGETAMLPTWCSPSLPSVTKAKNFLLSARSYSARRPASRFRASSRGVESIGPEKRSPMCAARFPTEYFPPSMRSIRWSTAGNESPAPAEPTNSISALW